MYDFTLFFEDCSEKFADFEEFAEKCEKLDPECAIDWDNLDATFYDFAFDYDSRLSFCKNSLNAGKDFNAMAKHQIKVQSEFRSAMSMWF
jgi:hypothetical protein